MADSHAALHERLAAWRAFAWHLAIVMTPLVVDDAAMLAMLFC